jgi:fluoride exporter
MNRLLLICLAGAAGTAARYLIGLWSVRRFGPEFPYGTVAVNMVGCFLIGGIVQIAAVQSWSETVRLVLTIGFLGGFTTYSSFNQETLRLASSGATGAAMVNVIVTLVGGLAAGWLGLITSRALLGR